MKVTVNLDLTPQQMAAVFADWDDEAQAQFFIEVVEIAKKWSTDPQYQWLGVSRHLKTCECSTEEARELIRSLAYQLIQE